MEIHGCHKAADTPQKTNYHLLIIIETGRTQKSLKIFISGQLELELPGSEDVQTQVCQQSCCRV